MFYFDHLQLFVVDVELAKHIAIRPNYRIIFVLNYVSLVMRGLHGSIIHGSVIRGLLVNLRSIL